MRAKLAILGKGEQQSDIVEAAARLGISSKVVCRFEFVTGKRTHIKY